VLAPRGPVSWSDRSANRLDADPIEGTRDWDKQRGASGVGSGDAAVQPGSRNRGISREILTSEDWQCVRARLGLSAREAEVGVGAMMRRLFTEP
jgi:hypothetical protein